MRLIKMKTLSEWQKEFPEGAKVKTPFYRSAQHKIRTVKEVFEAPFKSASSAWLLTDDGLSCDIAWFKKTE
jgi:hypothetical protein